MAESCNITYNRDKKEILHTTLLASYKRYTAGKSTLDTIKKTFKDTYGKKNVLITLVDPNNADDISKQFYEDIEDFYKKNKQSNPDTKLLNFKDALLGVFFDMNPTTQQDSNAPEEAKTDAEIQSENEVTLQDVLFNIFGNSINLKNNVQAIFERDLRNLIVYDTATMQIRNYNTYQANVAINTYINKKFKNILRFLKSAYPSDTTLQEITSMYSGSGELISKNYAYVVSKFNNYLETVDVTTLQNILINQQSGKQKAEMQSLYDEILNFFNSNEAANKWFNENFPTQSDKKFTKNLYINDEFSPAYAKLKNQLYRMSKDKTLNIKGIDELIKNIEKIESKDNVLTIVNDFVIMTRFDDLADYQMSDYIQRNKAYGKGVVPANFKNSKYIVKRTHKHQRAGFETANNENGESHTSITVKNILETIPVYNYKDDTLTSMYVHFGTLLQAFTNLQNSINEMTYTGAFAETTRTNLKSYFDNIQVDSFTNIIDIFETLFRPNKISGMSGRVIDTIQKWGTLTANDANILYSFYQKVLNKNNPYSMLYCGNAISIASDLTGLLLRNAENQYVDSSLTSDNTFGIFKKFNANYAIMNGVGRVNYNNLLLQKNPGAKIVENYKRERVEGNKFKSSLLIKVGNDTYEFGFTYTQDGNTHALGIFENGVYTGTEITRSSEKAKSGQVTERVIDRLEKIDLITFSKKIDRNEALSNDEQILLELFTTLDYYTGLSLNNSDGYELLNVYKQTHVGSNYLVDMILLGVQSAEAVNEAFIAQQKGKSLKQYLESESPYNVAYRRELTNTQYHFAITKNTAWFKLTNQNNPLLIALAESQSRLTGKNVRSTILNHGNNAVPNYNISSMGREIHRRLSQQNSNPSSPASSLLFVANQEALEPVPVIDAEVVTYSRQVKEIKDMSSVELFQRSFFDKFYGAFISRGKICFQPTVYSDKVTFLNYLASLSAIQRNGDDLMQLMYLSGKNWNTKNSENIFIESYKNTFFAAHSKILNNVITKYNKLIAYAQQNGLLKTNEVIPENGIERFQTFLRNRTQSELSKLVLEYNKNNQDKIELELDKDYRNYKDHCELNETLYYYASLYSGSRENLEGYLKNQLRLFLDDIRKYNFSLKVFESTEDLNNWKAGKEVNSRYNPYLKILSSEKILDKGARGAFIDQWVDKTTGELILENNLGEVNPLFKNFFYIEGLFSNNLRLSLTGSEINHPIKSLTTEYDQVKKIINEDDKLQEFLNNYNSNHNLNISVEQFRNAFNQCLDINDLVKHPELQALYEDSLLAIINNTEGTQFKRNNIIPATLMHLQTGLINGTARTVRVAVIDDMEAPVNNFNKSEKIKAQDGSAWMSGLQTRLENNSLGDQQVGIARKPIWDAQTGDLTSFQAKFAAFSITNELMRISMMSNSSQWKLFKKMHNIQWGVDSEGNNEVDLTRSIYKVGAFKTNDAQKKEFFDKYILGGQKLYYKNKYGEIVQILNLCKDSNGDYYTIEQIGSNDPQKVYHYFNSNSEVVSTEDVNTLGLDNFKTQGGHTINSLYELFLSIGGLDCVTKDAQPSEFSLDVLTNYVIYTGKKNNTAGTATTANDVQQTLKDKFIAYAFNSSAVKNGAKNVNSSNAWMDDSEFNTFELNVDGLGIQLNADHDVIDSEITEFSQVIATCAAYGKSLNSVNELYYALAKSAFENSKEELRNIQSLLLYNSSEEAEKNLYKLYLIIGKSILNSAVNNENDPTIQLRDELSRVLKVSRDQAGDELKIPFSDTNIYRQFITSITSVINAKSIKRKHPGMPNIMSPSYNMVQYFTYSDNRGNYRKYLYDDILKRARSTFYNRMIRLLSLKDNKKDKDLEKELKKKSFKELVDLAKKQKINDPYVNIDINLGTTDYNNAIVTIFLDEKQNKEQNKDKSWFIPFDAVMSTITYSDGTTKSYHHKLDDMQDYYKFKQGLTDIEDLYNVNITPNSTNTKFTISLNKNDFRKFKVEWNEAEGVWNIHFATGIFNKNTQRYDKPTDDIKLTEPQLERLFNAALQVIPNGGKIRLANTTEAQAKSGKGGLTLGSVKGYQNIIGDNNRHNGTNIQTIGEERTVTYFTENGEIAQDTVYDYIKISNISPAITYKVSTITPNNLKPQLMRWQYMDGEEIKYMNVFDLPKIRDSWIIGKELPREEVQKILDDLHNGKFTFGDQQVEVLDGTLEDYEAENIVSNMYRETFGIKENDSLADVLDGGKDYFKDLTKPSTIPTTTYNLAFTKHNGKHLLIQFGTPKTDLSSPDSFKNIYTDDKNRIFNKEGGIQIGRWIYDPNWKVEKIDDGIRVIDDTTKNEIDPSAYKIDGDKVYRKEEFLTKHVINKLEKVNGIDQYVSYTVYRFAPLKNIIDILTFRDGVSQKDKENAAKNLLRSVLKQVYEQDHYSGIQINTSISQDDTTRKIIAENLQSLGNDMKVDENGKWVPKTEEEIANSSSFERYVINLRKALLESNWEDKYKELRNDYYQESSNFNKRYSSFLGSLHLISSRIPADAMHSFMSMTTVGWIRGTNNITYVAPIQTWLQGSDYDIDKAYMMGQSFGDDQTYIGWSSLFDKSSYATLEASKTLPVPRGFQLQKNTSWKYNIQPEIDVIKGIKNNRAKIIKAYANLIAKIDSQNGNYFLDSITKEDEEILNKVQAHELYLPPEKYRDQAYKNAAAANIVLVINNIRNRAIAYQPITVDDLKDVAKRSPKSKETASLNMINPFSKYIMQQQNATGKKVVGGGANGLKDWYDITWYYHNSLLHNDNISNLKFFHNYDRIKGRFSGKIVPAEINHIPDMANASKKIRERIIKEFYNGDETAFKNNGGDVYVDSTLSEVLNAATDNAKELILAKINCGDDFAKYYIHLIMMGLDVKDIVSFMTSPAIELVAKYSNSDIYSETFRSASQVIKILSGNLPLSDIFVETQQKKSYLSEEDQMAIAESAQNQDEAFQELESSSRKKKYPYIEQALGKIYNDYIRISKKSSMSDFFEDYISVKTHQITEGEVFEYFKDMELPVSDDMNINRGFKFVDTLIGDINSAMSTVSGYTRDDLIADLEEFKRISDEANETTTLASTWLHLNQGIPSTDAELIKALRNMQASVVTRERKFGIYTPKDLSLKEDAKGFSSQELTQLIDGIVTYVDSNGALPEISKQNKSLLETIIDIQNNNKALDLSYIVHTLQDSIKKQIYGNFDIYKYLRNTDGYRKAAANYYNLIKATWNILDITESLPHYKVNLDLLNYSIQARGKFSVKGRLLAKIAGASELQYGSLNDQEYKKLARYADSLIVFSFFNSLGNAPITIPKDMKDIQVKDIHYNTKTGRTIYLNSINGIDTLKNFVENEFLTWLKTNYKNNALVKGLTLDSDKDKMILKTFMDLNDENESIQNQQTFNNYILGIKELMNVSFGESYTAADILMLYSLAYNGTRLGGHYLTAIFKDSIQRDSIMHKYFEFIGKQDSNVNEDLGNLYQVKDMLIALSPLVYSEKALKNLKTPYVRVQSIEKGFDLYHRIYDKEKGEWKYIKEDNFLQTQLQLQGSDKSEKANDFIKNTLMMFPRLHYLQSTEKIIKGDNVKDLTDLLKSATRNGKLLIYKVC